MSYRVSLLALGCALALPAAAQAPAGWQMRIDRSTSATDPDKSPDVKFVTMGQGFHVTAGPAAVLWKPENTASGIWTSRKLFIR